jgi:hypothetical protein
MCHASALNTQTVRGVAVAVAVQACDESLAKQSALQLAHRQQVSQLEDAVHVLKQQVCGSATVVVVLSHVPASA